MTEPSWYNVDPGESDASTKLDKGTNVNDSIKVPKFKSNNSNKFQVLQSQRVPSFDSPVYAVNNDLNRYYCKGELNLSGKHIRHLDILSFTCSYGYDLKELDVSGCGLTELRLIGLENCHGLKELNLSNNPLRGSYFNRSNNVFVTSLKKLDLSGCNLTHVDVENLTIWDKLEELNLSNNPLNCLDLCPSKFISWTGLKKLDLSGCGLTRVSLGDLEYWHRLEELNLSNNAFNDPNRLTLQHMKKLRKLNLSGCCLTKCPSGLEECSSLEELNLSYNFFGYQDLLVNLKNRQLSSQFGLHNSEKKLLEPEALGLSNLNNIIFEDAVYTKNGGG